METNKLVEVFKSELNLTEQGFVDLIEQKKNLVIDVTTEAGFKLARKERTEQNKVLKNIDLLAIDGKKAVDEARNTLKERVSSIYAPIITAFEAEDAKRKEIAAQKALVEEVRINKIKKQINSIRNFALNLHEKSSAEIQDIIEAVDLIDVAENFAEFTREALLTKKETVEDLSRALSSVIANEQLEAEREKLNQERKAQENQKRIDEFKAKAQERLNNLIMIPSSMFGKSSLDINAKLISISGYAIDEGEFGELFDSACAAKTQVEQQLATMAKQQEFIESSEAEQRKAQIIENDNLLKEREAEQNEAQIKTEVVTPSEQKDISPELKGKELMMMQLNFWKDEYGVRDSEFNDLMNIIRQHAYVGNK